MLDMEEAQGLIAFACEFVQYIYGYQTLVELSKYCCNFL